MRRTRPYNPTPAAFVQQARTLDLASVTTLSFPTMGRASDAQGGASRLVALKSVEAGYPLRGHVQVTDDPQRPGSPAQDIPAPGEVWVDAPLLDSLGLQLGDYLLLGDTRLRATRSGWAKMLFSPSSTACTNTGPKTVLRRSVSRAKA